MWLSSDASFDDILSQFVYRDKQNVVHDELKNSKKNVDHEIVSSLFVNENEFQIIEIIVTLSDHDLDE